MKKEHHVQSAITADLADGLTPRYDTRYWIVMLCTNVFQVYDTLSQIIMVCPKLKGISDFTSDNDSVHSDLNFRASEKSDLCRR